MAGVIRNTYVPSFRYIVFRLWTNMLYKRSSTFLPTLLYIINSRL